MKAFLCPSYFPISLISALCILDSMCSITNAISTAFSDTNDVCNLLPTRSFILNSKCLTYWHNASSFLAITPDICKTNMLQKSSQCEIIYWDINQKCISLTNKQLEACPLLPTRSDTLSLIYIGISLDLSTNVKKLLLRHGYRLEVQSILGCSDSDFLCDDFKCIDGKYLCDGSPQCNDRSDEDRCNENKKCLGRDGKYYDSGTEYVPNNDLDQCKACFCGDNGHPAYCYSPACSAYLTCTEQSNSICCQCFNQNNFHENFKEYPRRIVASCLSLLIIIFILLLLSRSFTRLSMRWRTNMRGTRAAWMEMRPTSFPPNRSFFDNSSRHPANFEFFESATAFQSDPPSYTPNKPLNQVEEAPPPYIESINPLTSNEHLQVVIPEETIPNSMNLSQPVVNAPVVSSSSEAANPMIADSNTLLFQRNSRDESSSADHG